MKRATTRTKAREEVPGSTGQINLPAGVPGLTELERNFHLLMVNTEESFILLDTNLLIVAFNDKFAFLYRKFLGLEVKKGSHILDYTPGSRKKQTEAVYKEVLAGKAMESELEVKLDDGSDIIVAIQYKPAYDEYRKVIGAFVSATDVTENRKTRQKLLQSEEKYRSIIENSFDAIILTSLEGDILEANKAAIEMFGYNQEELAEIGQQGIIDESDPGFRIFEETRKKEGKAKGELVGIRKNGECFHCEYSSVIFKDINDQIRISTIISDISENKKARENMNRSHLLLQKLTNKVPLAIYQFEISPEGHMSFPFMSEGIKQLWPGAEQEVLKNDASRMFSSLYHEDVDYFQSSIQKSMRDLSDWSIEFRDISPGGEIRWLKGFSRPERQNDGTTIWYGYMENITEKKLDAEKIWIEKERYEIVQKATNDAVWDWDVESDHLLWGEGFTSLFGYELKDNSRDISSWTKRIHPDDAEWVVASIKEAINSPLNQQWQEEYRFLKADGSIASVLDRGFVLRNREGKPIRMIGAMQDITGRKMAEEKIRIEKERYDMVIKATNDAIFEWDIAAQTVYWGDGYETLFGHKRLNENMPSSSWMGNLEPMEKDKLVSEIYEAFENKKTTINREYKFRCADGTFKTVFDKSIILYDDHKKPLKVVGALRDITRQKEEEERLKLLESVITNATDAVLITEVEPIDEPGPRIVYVNEAFTRMTGYTREEVLGKSPRILQGPLSDRNELNRLRQSLEKWEACEIETVNYTKNGKEFWNNIAIAPVANSDGWFTHWISIQRDVTEKRNHIQVIEEKNKKLSEIAWMQSHVVRAPVARIIGLINLLEVYKKGVSNPDLSEILGYIAVSAHKLDDIIRDVVKKTEEMRDPTTL